MTLHEYVQHQTVRGECKCGRCVDVGTTPDPTSRHTVDMVFFKVAPTPNAESLELRRAQFITLTRAHVSAFGQVAVDPLDGAEHSYLELGGWLGDQGAALQYMALGSILGVFTLFTPQTVLGLPPGDPLALQMAGAGYVTVKAGH